MSYLFQHFGIILLVGGQVSPSDSYRILDYTEVDETFEEHHPNVQRDGVGHANLVVHRNVLCDQA